MGVNARSLYRETRRRWSSGRCTTGAVGWSRRSTWTPGATPVDSSCVSPYTRLSTYKRTNLRGWGNTHNCIKLRGPNYRPAGLNEHRLRRDFPHLADHGRQKKFREVVEAAGKGQDSGVEQCFWECTVWHIWIWCVMEGCWGEEWRRVVSLKILRILCSLHFSCRGRLKIIWGKCERIILFEGV